jgi:predicted AlkP superfamily phosphohydrolase/phosphomutase
VKLQAKKPEPGCGVEGAKTGLTTEHAKSRVLVIGVDGGTWRVLSSAIEQGHMPFLRHLINNGASGALLSMIPAQAAPAWASLQTGRNPGKTGVFSSVFFDRTSRRPGLASTQLLGETIWELAGKAGKLVAAINVPLTWPARQVNGVMVTEPPASATGSDVTWPPELKDELQRAVSGYSPASRPGASARMPHGNIEQIVSLAADEVKTTGRLAEYLAFTRPPDLCMVHFGASDIVQRALWCYLDPQDPLYEEGMDGYILENFYGVLDQTFKETCDAFVRASDGNVTVFVISGYGFEVHRKRFYLGTWLHQQGLLQQTLIMRPWHERMAQNLSVDRLLKVLKLRTTREGTVMSSEARQSADLEGSMIYIVGDTGEAGIYLLHEDAPHRVNAIARITKGLKALRDTFTSAPIIHAVYRKEELYGGDRMHLMPDLVVVPAQGYSCSTGCLPNKPLVEDVNPDIDHCSGKPHPEGIFVAAGGAIAEKIGVRAHLLDVAPTILYTLGLAIPDDYDGKTIMDIFTSDFVSARGLPGAGGARSS